VEKDPTRPLRPPETAEQEPETERLPAAEPERLPPTEPAAAETEPLAAEEPAATPEPREPVIARLSFGLKRFGGPVGARLDRAVDFAGSRLRSGGEAVRIRQEQAELRKQRRKDQLALGEAAYSQDAAQIEALRRRMAETDRRIEALETERRQVLEITRRSG
jgi:hypothetical protein